MGGDVLLRDSIEFAQGDHFAAPLRQGPDGVGQKRQFLLAADGIGDTAFFSYDGQPFDFRYIGDRNNASTTKEIERDVARRGEEKSLRVTDRPGLLRLDQPEVGLLDDVVHVG